ncbi:MAG: tRNA preQ1(34) S-adenosylmethionine ribosyltransferase-isomerase QueA [Bacteroidales bacterium]|jgi:S-adenosylmethionine:tRNA ribosyltransferase-isomerase|nr:tRNA preQ1(34) S-adenosylmethionine ribosyltransferase-isomerase QueA [Bacteroidales bacterium]NPV35776.1 tRNA preQ1(34) S-adenosylmethionine ribosyltransferase-isomerase QueA [Bacteroidales bacterium]
MKLSQFKFHLPKELIADYPEEDRDNSRLMVLHRNTQTIEHRQFKDILEYFEEGDVFVLNNTKVFPARLYGEKERTGAKIEVFLLRELNRETRLWDVMVEPARKIRIGNKLYFGDNDELVAEVIDNTTSRGRTIRFLYDGPYEKFRKTLMQLGEMPLPKLHNRPVDPNENKYYQTIYAKNEGAVAAPTAGLHFTREMLKRLEIKGITFAEVTLHAGIGNFRDIEVEDLTKHKMDSEEMYVEEEAVRIINNAKLSNKRVCAVGTTTAKALETAATINGKVKVYRGWTNKFIFPPYTYQVPTAMITNFHLPLSPMLMQVCAFGGYDFVMRAYKEAIEHKYKFFTYGNAMLIV